MARDQARKNADRRIFVRRRRYEAAARNRARRRQGVDKLALRAGHNTLAHRGQAYKGRKAPDRQRYDWRRGWRQSEHPRPPAWGCRDNRAHGRRKSCLRAKAAPAVGNRPPLACAGSHKAGQNRATGSATVKGLAKTGQSWRQRTACKTRTRVRSVSARSIPSPGAMSPRRDEPQIGATLGRTFGCILGRVSNLAQRSTKRSTSSSTVANEVTSRMRTLSGPVAKLSLLRT